MKTLENIYDFKKKRFQSYFVPMTAFFIIMIGAFLVALFFGEPILLFMSFFALGISVMTLLYDQWVLNSITTSFVFLFGVLVIHDVVNLDFFTIIIHAPVIICSIIVSMRVNTSLIVMGCFSILVAIWVYTIQAWFPIPFYASVLWISGPLWQSIAVLVGSACVAVAITVKNFILKKVMGLNVRCENGICPL